jgi:uncharacterized membrane protein
MQNTLIKRALLFTALCLAMLCIRVYISQTFTFLFLVWNIFLAWLPVMLSKAVLVSKPKIAQWLLCLVAISFLPNSIYVVSDLIHIKQRQPIPLLYDALLLFVAATIGLLTAVSALKNIETHLSKSLNKRTVSISIVTVIVLCGFGVYLGRFLRWNTWDIITSPQNLLYDILHRLVYPLKHTRTWACTIYFAAIYSISYYGLYKKDAHV